MLKINKFIEDSKSLINERLAYILKKYIEPFNKDLYEMAVYSLFPGGKRLRPICLLTVLETYQIDLKKGLDVACAIELIHTYSLIHDDLPCLDNADMRRNKESMHLKFGEANALLVGDLLLTTAFEVIASSKDIDDKQKICIITTLSKNAGVYGMIGGQYLDVISEGKKIDFDMLKQIHIKKTACLISTALQCGAIISKATEKESTALKNFGLKLGFAYQIVDDLLDVYGDKDKMGKPKEIDIANQKNTSISILGKDRAKEEVRDLYENGILCLSALPYPPPLLKDLAYILIKRTF